MESDGEHLAEHAVELLSAARRLADSAADPATATHLPYPAGATLRLSRRACARANEVLVDVTGSGDPATHHG